jgi:hypothetical protein
VTAAIPILEQALGPTPPATSPSGHDLWIDFERITSTALQAAAVVAAQNLVNSLNANKCIPDALSLSNFQQAFHANNAGVVVSGVYDAGTAAAVGTTLGITPPACATPVNPSPTPLPPIPAPPPPPPPTTTPAAATTSGTTYAIIGIGAAIGLGALAYMMYAKKVPATRALARKNPVDKYDEAFNEDEMRSGYVISDGRRGGYVVNHEHRQVGVYWTKKQALKEIKEHMAKAGFYPNIYYVNDHGNVDLLSSTGRILASRV